MNRFILLRILVSIWIFVLWITVYQYDQPRVSFSTSNSSSFTALSPIPYYVKFKNIVFNLHFTLIPDIDCSSTELLIIVPSSRNSYTMREAIRSSWGGENVEAIRNGTVSLLFLIGHTNDEPTNELQIEARDHRDLILSDLEDSYENLIVKSVSLLLFSNIFCPTPLVMKIDQDVVFDIDRFMSLKNEIIRHNQSQPFIYGRVYKRSAVIRRPTHKWYVSRTQWEHPYFPRYCEGPLYILDSKAVSTVLSQIEQHHLVNIEDAFITGIAANGTQLVDLDSVVTVKAFSARVRLRTDCNSYGIPYYFACHGFKTRETVHNAYSLMKSVKCSTISSSFSLPLFTPYRNATEMEQMLSAIRRRRVRKLVKKIK